MRTMTSLEAQNHFGEMIDTSQRQPVRITRRGHPVSFVISTNGDIKEARFQFMKAVDELAPLRGKDASNTLARFFANNGNVANTEGLPEGAKSYAQQGVLFRCIRQTQPLSAIRKSWIMAQTASRSAAHMAGARFLSQKRAHFAPHS